MYPLTDDRTETKAVPETRNVNWQISPGPDGKLTSEQVTHALLIDIRDATRSVRSMMVFFTVLFVIGLVVEVIAVAAR